MSLFQFRSNTGNVEHHRRQNLLQRIYQAAAAFARRSAQDEMNLVYRNFYPLALPPAGLLMRALHQHIAGGYRNLCLLEVRHVIPETRVRVCLSAPPKVWAFGRRVPHFIATIAAQSNHDA